MAPFLPLLPDFLIGVELSAGKWPSHDITRVLDVARDSEVNLQTLVEELRVQAKAAPAYRKSHAVLQCHSMDNEALLHRWRVVTTQLESDSEVSQ